MTLTLSYSPCPNDCFIFDAIVHRRIDLEGLDFDVRLADVEALNRSAFAGDADITKLSYHAYAHCVDRYVLLDAGSALGRHCGPLLISKRPIAQDDVGRKRAAAARIDAEHEGFDVLVVADLANDLRERIAADGSGRLHAVQNRA